MSNYNEEYKKQLYKKWLDNGRPWFDIDKSKEPTWEERKIVLEMLEIERNKSIRDIELEKRTKDIRERYEKKGLLPDIDTMFKGLDNY